MVVRLTGAVRRLALPAGVIAALAAAAAGYLLYRTQVAPFATTVLRFDGTSISMRYLLARTASSAGHTPLHVLQQISFEQLLAHTAPYPPYGITIADGEVNAFLRRAAGGTGTLSDAEFDEWYRQQVNESRMSAGEFRDLVRIRLLRDGMVAHLRSRVPTVAEQILLYRVVTDTGEEAEAVRRRLLAGARPQASEADVGWYPRPALGETLAEIVFDRLQTGIPSDPIRLRDGRFAVLLVAERSPARPVDEPVLAALRESAMQRWVEREIGNHSVSFHGLRGDWDSETNAWAMEQLARMRRTAGGAAWSPFDPER